MAKEQITLNAARDITTSIATIKENKRVTADKSTNNLSRSYQCPCHLITENDCVTVTF